MVEYSKSSARSDGTANLVVMNGKPGYVGYSSVFLRYIEDGWITISGSNMEDKYGWKLLSEFTLDPGKYTLTGMKGVNKETIALQLRINDVDGYSYFYQYNEDTIVVIKQQTTATLHVMVYPKVEEIDVKARPAVYKDE